MKSPQQRPSHAAARRHHAAMAEKEPPRMHRFAYGLIAAASLTLLGLIALLLSDALAPGRLPPMLGFWAATMAGFSLVIGLALLEPQDATS
jgi:hypothetical protein